jgi:hypothetical protein
MNLPASRGRGDTAWQRMGTVVGGVHVVFLGLVRWH